MSDVKIVAMGEGTCAECDRQRQGVRFGLLKHLPGETQFLCWEHFRLFQESLKPGRVEVQSVTRIVSCDHRCCGCSSCCCRGHTCGCSYGRRSRSWSSSEMRGESVGISRTQTEGISESASEGVSRTHTLSIQHTEGRSRSESEGWTTSYGTSHGVSSSDSHGTTETDR